MSRNAILVLILALCAFGAWKHFGGHAPRAQQAASIESGVVVYGRDTCGYTQNMLKSLRAGDVPFTYVNIDAPGNSGILYDKFHETKLSGGRGYYLLPVVEVAGQANMRPDADSVIKAYRHGD